MLDLRDFVNDWFNSSTVCGHPKLVSQCTSWVKLRFHGREVFRIEGARLFVESSAVLSMMRSCGASIRVQVITLCAAVAARSVSCTRRISMPAMPRGHGLQGCTLELNEDSPVLTPKIDCTS
eukprot:6283108-Amphidinium_carterae.2